MSAKKTGRANTFTEENYLKAIYKLCEYNNGTAGTNAIAEVLKTKAASVTDMVQRLATKKLIQYKPYQGVSLSANGRRLAVDIIRRHRLWELFLVKHLSFRWDEVHEMAEQLEHVGAEGLVDRLDRFLGYPKFDPHGDPIPDKNGKLITPQSVSLSEVQPGNTVIMTGVVDHSAEFLQHLSNMGLSLGASIRVTELFFYDRSMEIKISKGKTLHISFEVAKNILTLAK